MTNNDAPETVQTVQSQTQGKGAYFEVAKRKVGETEEWHWCLWSANGRRMATNCEPYYEKKAAIAAIRLMVKNCGNAKNIVMVHTK